MQCTRRTKWLVMAELHRLFTGHVMGCHIQHPGIEEDVTEKISDAKNAFRKERGIGEYFERSNQTWYTCKIYKYPKTPGERVALIPLDGPRAGRIIDLPHEMVVY